MAADSVRRTVDAVPRFAVVLGSGLSGLTAEVADPVSIPFSDVPGLPPVSVSGHEGRFVFGRLDDVPVLLQAGRLHAYEGLPMDVVVGPVRLLGELGVEVVAFTNAAGAIHPRIEPGDLVLLDDHLNLTFRGPLVGSVIGDEGRFPDMSQPYDRELQWIARAVAAENGVGLEHGTYAAVLGPQYETGAEIRMLAQLGADVVGMSTVPEVIAARALGLRCIAFSMVTNKATGLGEGPISHGDVLDVSARAAARLMRVIRGLLRRAGPTTHPAGTK